MIFDLSCRSNKIKVTIWEDLIPAYTAMKDSLDENHSNIFILLPTLVKNLMVCFKKLNYGLLMEKKHT